jgi:DNA-binding NtrC family response regulator
MAIRRILVVDDDPHSRDFLVEACRTLGFDVAEAGAPLLALEQAAEQSFDLVITDLRMPEMDGMQLLGSLGEVAPGLPVLLVTAHGSVETAVEAMRQGAADFVQKPVAPEALQLAIARIDRTQRLAAENAYLRQESTQGEPQLVARSERMIDTLEAAARIARSKGTVLITGESGTGKERVASFIHQNSPRSGGPFVRVNCAALSEQLLESELFGHEKGAFTGAHKRHQGRFELADGGTLMLDEIGEISPNLQAKLLRVLEEEEFERVGGTQTLKVDVRVIATTNRHLPDEVAEGLFREDLYYRLHVLPLHLAPLRERSEDVLPLAEHFTRHYARQNGCPVPVLTTDAKHALASWSWPGNVRELENVVQRAVVLADDGAITPQVLVFGPSARLAPAAALPAAPTEAEYSAEALADRKLADIERDAILATLDSSGGNKTEAARRLGVTARTLSNKMKLWRELGLVS